MLKDHYLLAPICKLMAMQVPMFGVMIIPLYWESAGDPF